MADPHQRRYSPEEVSAIVQRALEGSRSVDETVSYADLVDTARELGISTEALENALADQESRGEIEAARKRLVRKRRAEFYNHLRSYLIVNGALLLINFITSSDFWVVWPLLGWGIGLAFHASSTFFVSDDALDAAARRMVQRNHRHRARKQKERDRHSGHPRTYHS